MHLLSFRQYGSGKRDLNHEQLILSSVPPHVLISRPLFNWHGCIYGRHTPWYWSWGRAGRDGMYLLARYKIFAWELRCLLPYSWIWTIDTCRIESLPVNKFVFSLVDMSLISSTPPNRLSLFNRASNLTIILSSSGTFKFSMVWHTIRSLLA